MRILAFIAALVLGSIPVNGHAAAGPRVALVIGNGDYVSAADMPLLPNPSNDAQAMASKLRTLDFDVIEVRDGTYGAMIDGLRRFSREASGAEVALFYYAGHGLQADGENYLMPVDAEIEIPADLDYESLLVSRVREELERADPDVSLVILDACRNNPLSRSLARNARALGRSVTTDQGLARMAGASGMLIAYATDPNNVALDGRGDNSPFTSALLEHLDDPVDARVMFARVRAKVVERTNGAQTPWVEESVIGEFSIAGMRPQRAEETPTNPAPRKQGPSGAMVEVAFWNSIAESEDPEEFRAYLDQYPEGRFAALAKRRMDNLTAEPDAQEVSPEEIENRLGVGRSMLRAVQTRLDEAGHDPGPIDGLMGSRTRNAIQAFERTRDLPPDGYLDEKLLAALNSAASGIPLHEVEQAILRGRPSPRESKPENDPDSRLEGWELETTSAANGSKHISAKHDLNDEGAHIEISYILDTERAGVGFYVDERASIKAQVECGGSWYTLRNFGELTNGLVMLISDSADTEKALLEKLRQSKECKLEIIDMDNAYSIPFHISNISRLFQYAFRAE